jgi:hypothetical protein
VRPETYLVRLGAALYFHRYSAFPHLYPFRADLSSICLPPPTGKEAGYCHRMTDETAAAAARGPAGTSEPIAAGLAAGSRDSGAAAEPAGCWEPGAAAAGSKDSGAAVEPAGCWEPGAAEGLVSGPAAAAEPGCATAADLERVAVSAMASEPARVAC